MIYKQENLLGYFRFYYSVVGRRLLVSIFLSICVSVLDGLGLSMFMPLLQSVSNDGNASQKSMGQLHYITDAINRLGFSITLDTVLVTLTILFAIKGAFKLLEMKYQASVVQYFMKKVRHQLVKGLENLSYRGFTELDAGLIQNSFIAEVQRMSGAVRNFLTYSQAFFMLITYVAFAMLANYQFAILLAICGGGTNLLYSSVYKKMKNASYEVSKRGTSFNSFMIQAVHHFKYLKATNYIKPYSRKLDKVIDQTEALNNKISHYNAVTTGLREPMVVMMVALVIYLQINLMGGQLGSIILSLILFYRALNYLIQMQQNWQNFLQSSGSLKSVSQIAELMKEKAEIVGTETFSGINEKISLVDVCVSYSDHRVLNKATINIPKNNTVALVGESGSGKTTLANIIIGLIKPDEGKVLLDGKPISAFNLDTYRGKVGYISQEPVIFNDDIYNNITFWDERTPENETRFWQIVELASLTDFIDKLPGKENSRLGDNGILISGGQKQRISIARELYKKAELLILDEATSALDSETELAIQENIEKLHGKYTMVVIAHRLSTIRNVDRIYLLEQGSIIESGDFTSMVKQSSKFKRMIELQGL
ncbi:ATP-binding cassette, subfamily B, MsbA [Cnuella takakiae]|uniref:Multidrug resistance-like ATP-binding protein MdlB n=1 Tax=Cnuella takakiae TaxID=1302690 RepID=A0A1M4YDU7_9BACT|nr:ABC transporter ATP-binding protein [Cnuella takakiae]OLY93122.1 xenobiotic-transporting ATPase [Cnuella takakiae]SHF03905.1 ATP-binding cassette, subfamily B, MsbA [Cnuella takakiae]